MPATGTCTLSSPALIIDGSTYVKGKNAFPYLGSTDASASSTLKARAWVGGAFAYYHYSNIGSDATKSESRTKAFDKTAYLQSDPSFYATAGQHIEVEIVLENNALSNSEGEASVSLFQFGFLATSTADLVRISS